MIDRLQNHFLEAPIPLGHTTMLSEEYCGSPAVNSGIEHASFRNGRAVAPYPASHSALTLDALLGGAAAAWPLAAGAQH
jgi:hypothetical protein